MITNEKERAALNGINLPDSMSVLVGVLLCGRSEVHFDCEAKIIKPGDEVEVVKEDELRLNSPAYKFCSKGKKGKILGHLPGCNSWFVEVQFTTENGKLESVGCVDYHLQKVA